ncbi:epidermal growth factor-like protein 7 isoform X1 [Poecile atricapillus]|uniref:epidermal growth factor-like protein 7 isoform X1 n=1 Tax=Poecile atricapillus TaxID=48891 RepID=UPI002739501E|nr:epidermal growth factor-like protein 7 isoform X1 [Poecile atricapillus]
MDLPWQIPTALPWDLPMELLPPLCCSATSSPKFPWRKKPGCSLSKRSVPRTPDGASWMRDPHRRPSYAVGASTSQRKAGPGGAAGGTGHAEPRLPPPPLGTPPHPQHHQHRGLCPGRPQGVRRGAQRPERPGRVPRAARVPTLPHHLPGPPPLQHLQLSPSLPCRTIYRVVYRQRHRQLPEPTASCCPGWSRANGHTLGCNRALCWEPCQNGGSCAFPGRCSCPPGWTGRACQTDVDECASQSHGCSQLCINTAGSFHCACRDGFSLAADGKGCQPLLPAAGTDTSSQAGPSSEMKEEMEDLRSRVEALEQKLQLVLAPFHNLMPPEDVGADPISRLSHSLQQLDRIDSLSEQISFLEERLETCSCKNEL